jgi:hypothetical protein
VSPMHGQLGHSGREPTQGISGGCDNWGILDVLQANLAQVRHVSRDHPGRCGVGNWGFVELLGLAIHAACDSGRNRSCDILTDQRPVINHGPRFSGHPVCKAALGRKADPSGSCRPSWTLRNAARGGRPRETSHSRPSSITCSQRPANFVRCRFNTAPVIRLL